jgi:2-C-methyl-D-erythritol 2,4-cyclodiphosphate synthase
VDTRVGIGFDIHRLVEGRRLVLGGVELDSPVGLAGHSDADVVLHAITDAVLGAAGLPDIGEHFPDTDAAWKDADSATFLRHAVGAIGERGFAVGNVDVNVLAEKPRLGPVKNAMRRRIADLTGLTVDRISVKARTMEGLGAIGEARAIAAQAVVMLVAK